MFNVLSSVFVLIFVIGSGFTDDTRITGGHIARNGDFPYQVSLQIMKSNFALHFCGGTLIKPDKVLTAAYCTLYPVNMVSVSAGDINLQLIGIRIPVSKYIVHEKFKNTVSDYDVAILVLKYSFTISTNIKTIELTDVLPKDGANCTVSGWGLIFNGATTTDLLLRSTTVQIVNNKTCVEAYKFMTPITNTMICAGNHTLGKNGICQGDFGGPLVYNNKIVGIASFSFGCATPNIPDVYTNVYQLSSWIKTNGSETLIINNMHLAAILIVSMCFTFLYK